MGSRDKIVQAYKVRPRSDQCRYLGYTYTKGRKVHVVINLGVINLNRRKRHRGQPWLIKEIISTLDHELIHALIQNSDWAPAIREERFVLKAERAGKWARA